MEKRSLFVRRVLCLLCLAAAAGVLGYRAVLRFAPDKLREEVRSEIETLLNSIQMETLRTGVLLKKAALEAGRCGAAGDALACKSLPARYLASYDVVGSLGLRLPAEAFADGRPLAEYALREAGDVSTIDGFPDDAEAVPEDTEAVLWRPFRIHPLTRTPSVSAVYPVRARGQTWRGFVTCDMDVFELQKLVVARALPDSLTADVLDSQGVVLASSRPSALMRPAVRDAGPDFVRAIRTVLSTASGDLDYEDGGERCRLLFDTMPETGWKVCIRSRTRDVYKNVTWFLENNVRVYSCCGSHTLRRTPQQPVANSPSPEQKASGDKPRRLRRFDLKLSQ